MSVRESGAIPAALNGVIEQSADVMSGATVFARTRVPVQALFDYLRAGDSLDRFLDHFPTVTREQAETLLAHVARQFESAPR